MPPAPRDSGDATRPAEWESNPAKPTRASQKKVRQRFAVAWVVGAPGITSLAQLAGKPVSFGLDGDASQALGRRMFAKLGLKVEETPLDFANALDGVSTGDVAAVLVLHDRDVAKLRSLQGRDLHLLPVPGGARPPAGMAATTRPSEAAGILAYNRQLRAFAVDAARLPRLRQRMASAK